MNAIAETKELTIYEVYNDENPQHFYASSFCTWKTGEDIREVIKHLDKEGNPYTLWLVPGSSESNYEIRRYAPQVEGAIVLGHYTPTAKRKSK
jgi:hypothetical protein